MNKKWKFAPPRPRRAPKSTSNSGDKRDIEPWLKAILSGIRLNKAFLILVNNPSGSNMDRLHMDDQLAEIAVMQSIISDQTSSGKEISALKDVVGFAPYTFSEVGRFFPGSNIQLAQTWDEEGMPTLLPMSICPPKSDEDRRMAVLYGIGDPEDLNNLENAFLEYFDPTYYTPCFSYANPSQDGGAPVTKYFVQWELFPEEAAQALGVLPDSQDFEDIMNQLEQQASPPRATEHTKETKAPTSDNGWSPVLQGLKS